MTSRRPPILLVFAVTVTGIMSNSLISPALPDILDEFGRSDAAAGILVASGSLPGVVVAPAIGVAADRFGRKRVLVPCLLGFGVFGTLAALAPSFEVLLIARLLMGFGSAGLINLSVVMIGDHWAGTERTRMIGRNSAVLTSGLAAMPLLSGLLTDLAGWRVALSLYALSLVTACATLVVLDDHRPAQPGDVMTQLRDSVALIRTPVMRTTLIAGATTFALVFGVFLATLPVHLEDDFDLSARWIGLVIAVPAITSTLVSMNLATLRRIVGLRGLLAGGAALLSVAFLTLGLSPVLVLVVIAAAAYGLGEGAIIPSLQDVTASVAPDHLRGGVMAAWVGAARLGQTTGPLVATALVAATDTGTAMAIGGASAALLVALKALGPIDDAALERARVS